MPAGAVNWARYVATGLFFTAHTPTVRAALFRHAGCGRTTSQRGNAAAHQLCAGVSHDRTWCSAGSTAPRRAKRHKTSLTSPRRTGCPPPVGIWRTPRRLTLFLAWELLCTSGTTSSKERGSQGTNGRHWQTHWRQRRCIRMFRRSDGIAFVWHPLLGDCAFWYRCCTGVETLERRSRTH